MKDLSTNSNSRRNNPFCLNGRCSTTRLVNGANPSEGNELAGKMLYPSSCGDYKIRGGLRERGLFKASLPEKPLVSVITVVLNSEQYIEQTIESVLNQTYDNIEYIVIDGGSTDGTLGKIKKYDQYIDCWLSGPDKGIYHAMNFGFELANGDWINFMNSADRFFDGQAVEKIFADMTGDVDIIYGNCQVRYRNFERIKKAAELGKFWRGMPFCHQSAFCRAALFEEHPFDTAYEISADFDFFYKTFMSKGRFHYFDGTVSSIAVLGLSDYDRPTAIKENWRCVATYSHSIKIHFYYGMRMMTCAVKALIKKVLGRRLTSRIQRLKYEPVVPS